MGTTRRYRATVKTKIAKPKKSELQLRIDKMLAAQKKGARFTAREVKAIYELGRASGARDLSTSRWRRKPLKEGS